MGSLVSGIGPLASGWVLATLDIGSYLMSNDIAAMMASLFAAFFGGLANAFISILFGGGA